MKHFLRNNAGSTLVELALTAPLLLVILIASAELGRIAYYAIEVQSAARAGAAFGAQNVGFALGTTNGSPVPLIEQAAQNDVSNITVTFPSPGPTSVCVCETITNSTGTPSYTPSTGPISCYISFNPNVLNQDFTDQSCNTTNSIQSQQVIVYIQVSTQAIVKPMFNYPGIPSSFTLSGTSTMRVLQN